MIRARADGRVGEKETEGAACVGKGATDRKASAGFTG